MPFSSHHERKPSRNRAHRKGFGPMRGDKSSWELDLERSGEINILQRYRLGQYLRQLTKDNSGPPFISHRLHFIEEDLREVVQEEISIKEGFDVLGKCGKEKQRLDVLNIKYWLLEQQWWHYHSCLQDGYERRGFELWRSHPKWYMHRVLIEYCASRQGCCARGFGHCTFECGCCRRARGFEISEGDKILLKEKCREEIGNLPIHRIVQVAIWGLVGDSYDSPFDMIDAPPS
ncbi:unnamed protein product [Penicillium nalgiovense]|nr:unnamed protein product [Penicillium nalgiovense]